MTEAEGEAKLSDFPNKGFAGPLRLMTAEDMARRREELVRVASRPSPLYDRADVEKHKCSRNRYLDSLAVLELACHPTVVASVASALGPNVVLWRTEFYFQTKSDPETMWHQDRQFSGPRRLPSLVIPDAAGKPPTGEYREDEMRGDVPMPRSVSAWLAIADTDRDTGCVMVVESSNQEGVIPVRKARPGEKQIFAKGTVLDYEVPEARVKYMELTAGEFFIFDRLTLHASMPTRSETPRLGISFRYTTPDVLIYPGYTIDGHGFAVSSYKALLVHGEDPFGYNRSLLETAEARRQILKRGLAPAPTAPTS